MKDMKKEGLVNDRNPVRYWECQFCGAKFRGFYDLMEHAYNCEVRREYLKRVSLKKPQKREARETKLSEFYEGFEKW